MSLSASVRNFLALATSSKLRELVAYLACLCASVIAARLIALGGAVTWGKAVCCGAGGWLPVRSNPEIRTTHMCSARGNSTLRADLHYETKAEKGAFVPSTN